MSDDTRKSREEVINDWLARQHQAQRAERKARRLPDSEATVTINSLMDAMTIILVFLLMNYSVDPLRIDTSEDLKLPASTTDINPKASAAVTVTAKGILVNDKVVVAVKDGTVDKAFKGGDEASLQIQPLFDALTEAAQTQQDIAMRIGSKFEGVLTVIAHEETPYRLVTEVLYTAGQAEFQKFKFAVVKGAQRGG
ncbi:MAG: biopolymer transporter ExbD [Myxococcales bacterium]|nr:biopolymer transporter ExbD [Myxococcales bacterium]